MSRICAIMSESAAAPRGHASARGTSAARASARRVRYDEVTTDDTALAQDSMRPQSLVVGRADPPYSRLRVVGSARMVRSPDGAKRNPESAAAERAAPITLPFIQATSR